MKRLLIAAALLIGACSSDAGSGAHAGSLTLALTSGGFTDGAIIVIVSGGPVTSVDAPDGYQVATNADGQGTHIMVLGNVAVGRLATLNIPDVSRSAAYVATVVQVADRNAFTLQDIAPYHVTVTP